MIDEKDQEQIEALLAVCGTLLFCLTLLEGCFEVTNQTTK